MCEMIKTADYRTILIRLFASLVGGMILFSLVTGMATISFLSIYQGRIFPGVSMGWVNLSGQTPEDALDLLRREYSYPEEGKITLQYDDLSWEVHPAELGLFFSPNFNAERAFHVGRKGLITDRIITQIQVVRNGINLAPQFVLDEETGVQFLEGIAGDVNQDVVEAAIQLEGLEVIVQPGQIGREMDIQASLDVVALQLRTLQDGSIPLIVNETYPLILDVSAQAELARRILSQPLIIKIPDQAESDPGPWTLTPDTLVEMMILERISTNDGDSYRIALDSEKLREYLVARSDKINREPKNARLYFDDNTRELVLIEEEQTGLELDVDQSILTIQEGLADGEHEIALAVERTLPVITKETTAKELGITELVRAQTTYFGGSDSSRINNIATAAEKFHGIFVAPGETFSMAEQLGNVTLDEGYSEAWIIFGDRTIKGVGGGVCQVSTTLFRTVFFGGFPIVERHPHAYRVLYYEQNPNFSNNPKLAGLDATVYVPVVDFKFTNDTDYWLLMETYISKPGRWLTWKFYSTSDGRKVDWDTTGLKNKKDPPDPIYEENPELAKGEVKQVDWAVEGATVTVTRRVYRDGRELWEDIFKTKYQPWAAVCQYGPGTGKMPPKNPDPDNPCKKKK
jgi:vancomycin resistance protein YoaR